MMTPDEILRQADEQIASRKSANKPATASGAQSDDGWRDPWSEAPTPRGLPPSNRTDEQAQQPSSDGFGARLKQGVGRAVDYAQVALSGDEGVIAKVAADQQRNALPQTALQRQMAEEIAPYNEAAKNAEGFADSARAWGSLGLKRAGQLLSNPAEAGKMMIEQVPNSIPGLAGGFAGAKAGAVVGTAVGGPGFGTAAGAVLGGLAGGFAGGYGIEKGASVIEQVQEKAHQQGVDLQDQVAARGFVAKNLAEIDAAATRKGVGTAGTDAALNVLTMGAAGLSGRGIVKEARALAKAVDDGVVSAADATAALARLEAANAARNTVGQKALRGGAVVGAEMAGEGVSEAVGQKYAYGEVDPGQVIDEALLGLGQGGAMALGGKAFRKTAGLPDNDDAATRSLDDVHSALAKNAGLQQDGALNDGNSGGGGVDAQAGNPAFDSTNAPAPFINQGVMDVNGLGPRPPAPVLDTQRLDALLEPQRPSEAMGLRTGPDAGPLENAAALSVDTGAAAQMQGAAGIVANDLQSEPQAANAMQAVNLDEAADPYEQAMLQRLYDDHFADGDLESVISANAELDTSFDFGANVNQLLANAGATPQEIEDAQRGQASAQAADRPGQAQENDRSNFDAELSVAKNEGDGSGRLAGAKQGEASQQPVDQQAAAPGSQAEGANVAILAQLNRKKLAEMSDDELQQLSSMLPADHNRQQKIQKAIQARAAQAQAAINEGVKADGTQTNQAQQGSPQPAQAGAAQAGQQTTPVAASTNAAPNAVEGHAQTAPEFTTIKTIYGDSVTVRTSDLNSDKTRLRQYTRDGKSKAVPAIHRDDLDATGEKSAALAEEVALFNADAGQAQQQTAQKEQSATETVAPTAGQQTNSQRNASESAAGQAQAATNNLPANLQEGIAASQEKSKQEQPPALTQQAQAAAENVAKGLDGDALERKADEVMEKVVAPGMLNLTRDQVRALIQEKGMEAADKTIADYQESKARQAETIRKYSEAKEKAGSARKAQSATEQQAAPGRQSAESAYTLPAGSISDEWRDDQKRDPGNPYFTPTPRQQRLMDEVKKVLDSGAFYNDDVTDKVAKALGVSDEVLASNRTRVQGGDFGYDVYHARKAVEAQAQEADAAKIRAELNLRAGDKLGTLIFNDFKQTNSVEVVSITEDGRRASLKGKRGAFTVTFETTVPTVKFAIERAHERGKRKDSYEEFIAGRSANLQEGDAEARRFEVGESLTNAQPQDAPATHADPGQTPEAATPAVVAESLQKAARNEDTKPSEMRKWLLAEIDKELLQAPDRADYDEAVKRFGEKDAISMFTGNGPLGKNSETGFITFDVPGDGKYKVRNSVRGLLEFRKNVMASSGFKDGGQKQVKPEQNQGVQGGSGGKMAAITNMIEEGDFEAARDYAEAVGIKLEDVKVPRGDMKPAWEKYLKGGALPPAPDTRPQPAPKTAAQLDEEKRQAAEAEAKKPKDTGWNMAGTGYGGKRYIGRNITLDDGREVVARIYENAGTYEGAEVKVDGVRKFAVTDRDNAQGKADAFIRTLASNDVDASAPVAQPVTRADVEAAQQQAAAIIGARIDAMSAGDVNKIAKQFLPTMGMKPTMSKANNKAAMTDAKINLMAAAAEVGAVLPAEVTRALQADMEGHVVDAAKPAAPAQQEASKPKKLPPFPVDGYRLEGYYANGAKVKPLPAKAFSPTEVQSITDWFKSIGWSVTSGSGANGVNATNDVGMTVDDLPEPYTAAQRKKDEAQKAADERAADKKNAQDDYLASNDAGKFVSDMFGDSMNRFNLTALAKVLAGDEKTFGGLFSNRAADVLADAGISTEGRQVKDIVADIKATFDAAQQDAKNPARAAADGLAAAKQEPGKRIEDFGEKLEGARKDLPPSLKEEVSDEQMASLPLSKIWPANAHEEIQNDAAAALAFAARQEIPAKPRQSVKVQRWVQKVKNFRALVTSDDALAGNLDKLGLDGLSQRVVAGSVLEGFFAKVRLLAQLPRDTWGRVEKVGEYPDAVRYGEDGKKTPAPFSAVVIDGEAHQFDGAKSIGPDEVSKIKELLGAAAPKKGGLTAEDFEIRTYKNRAESFINRKGDKEMRPLKTFTGQESGKQAREWLKANVAQAEAQWEAVKARDNVGKGDVRTAQNRQRVGVDHRKGADVTAQMFEGAFGFRGVQFGNWVAQGAGAKDRQGLLNEAYDALMDLSLLLGVPSRAMSLDGSLGLSLGARGSGKAAAHFEHDSLVINLTKTKGAGSLAHEWFHALDNYFRRQRGGMDKQAGREDAYITYKPEAAWVPKAGTRRAAAPLTSGQLRQWLQARGMYDSGKSLEENAQAANFERDPQHKDGVRPQVEAAFAQLVQALNDSPMAARATVLDGGVAKGYWGRIIERGARSFENYVINKMALQGYSNDFLANIRSFDEWQALGKNADRYPYLTPAEEGPVVEAFDNLFGTIETRQGDDGNVAMFSRRDAKPVAEADRQFKETERAYGGREAYDRAKAAGKTKLTYGQWVQVRTPNFKAWFGDWEAVRARQLLDGMTPVSARLDAAFGEDFSQAKAQAKAAFDKLREATERDGFAVVAVDGREIAFSGRGFKEVAQHAADRRVLSVAANLKPLFESAVPLYSTEPDASRGKQQVAAFHYYGVKADFGKDGQAFVLLEVVERSNGDFFYDADATSVEEIRAASSTPLADQTKSGAGGFSAARSGRLSQWWSSVNPADVSKVVDPATGEPLVVYHGTEADFSEFSREYIGSANTQTPMGSGFFFAKDPAVAGRYAERASANVMPVYVSVQNPAPTLEAMTATGSEYDGFINSKIVVARSSLQVKSATGNNGNFDPANPDIRYSRMDDNAATEGVSNEQRQTPNGIPAGLPATSDTDSQYLERQINNWLQTSGWRADRLSAVSLPIELRTALDRFTDTTGTRVVLFRNLTPEIEDFNGVNFRDGRVFINETSQHPATLTAAHEWVHNLKRTNPELYQLLEDEVRDQGRIPEWHQRNTQEEGQDRGIDHAVEELTAAAVSDAMTDPAFLEQLAQRNQSVFRRVARAFLDFLDTLTAGWRDQGSNAYLRDVQAFRDKLADVLDRLPATGQGTANFAANPARRPGTAQDKAVMRAIADGKSARDVLCLIANGSKDPFLRQVARLLLKAGITPNIQFGYIGKTAKGDPIHGQYRGKSEAGDQATEVGMTTVPPYELARLHQGPCQFQVRVFCFYLSRTDRRRYAPFLYISLSRSVRS